MFIIMERKEFLKKSLLGGGMLISSALSAGLLQNDIDELKELEAMDSAQVGFNHLPNIKSTIMENKVLHKANTRGHANHGWLDTHHTFSFASYYNPDRLHFGVLRVLNDDVVDGGMGFGMHPHDNMEIISIPLEGDLEHKDSMGNTAIIKNGDIQVMSAGTGIRHSEYNKNKNKTVKFLQIWVFPNKKNITPRYDQITLQPSDRHNKLQQIVSPNPNDAGVWIHQDAWFHLGTLDQGNQQTYTIQRSGNGVYAFLISGSAIVDGIQLDARDGMGIWATDHIQIEAKEHTEILLMDVPMTL